MAPKKTQVPVVSASAPMKGAKKKAIEEWWKNADKSYTSKDAEPLITAFLATKGLEFKKSDIQSLITAGREAGKFIGMRGNSKELTRSGGFSGFVTEIVNAGVDAQTLGVAIEIISANCENVTQAKQWADKWGKILELAGDATKAQEMVQLFTGE